MTTIALDTSVAIPLLVDAHDAHETAVRLCAGHALVLAGHAAVETYSVLTRLPGDVRVAPADAARLLSVRFGTPLTLSRANQRAAVELMSAADIAGGSVYDALVAYAAKEHDVVLATRDARALATYERVGARVTVVADG